MYQPGAFDGSAAYSATPASGRSMMISVSISTFTRALLARRGLDGFRWPRCRGGVRRRDPTARRGRGVHRDGRRDSHIHRYGARHDGELYYVLSCTRMMLTSRPLRRLCLSRHQRWSGSRPRSLADVEDVTSSQFRVLVVLRRPGAVTVGDLAQVLDVHSSTATRLCERLERKRLVLRRSGVSSDRRETLVSLTATGRRLVDRVTDRRRRDLTIVAFAMAPGSLGHAIRGFGAFAAAAGEVPGAERLGWG